MTRLHSVRAHIRRSPAKSEAYQRVHAELKAELAAREACREIESWAGMFAAPCNVVQPKKSLEPLP